MEKSDSHAESAESTEISLESAIDRLPYYLESFKWIIHSILHRSEFSQLFATDSGRAYHDAYDRFESLELPAQKLYVRLFLRKHAWIPRNKISYSDLGDDDPSTILRILVKERFILNQPESDLDATLSMLNLQQLKDLAREFKVSLAVPTKDQILSQLRKKCTQQRDVFGRSLKTVLCAKAVKLIGEVYILEENCRKIFALCFNLIQLFAGVSSIAGQNPVFALLQLNLGRIAFPIFKVSITSSLFWSLDEINELDLGKSSCDEIDLLICQRNFTAVRSEYHRILPKWEKMIDNSAICSKMRELPIYLRRFSGAYYYTKCVERGLTALERLDEKSDALNGYLRLLEQNLYVVHHRGHWYNRLTILMLKIDKNYDAAARMLHRGIADPFLRDYQKLELQNRLERIQKRVRRGVLAEISGNVEEKRVIRKHLSVEIKGSLCEQSRSRSGGRTVFLAAESSEEATTVCSVEELALAHYKKQGYMEGSHVEGSLIASVYGLLFWDVIYADGVADVFRSSLQAAPLDFHCPSFWTSRSIMIQEKLCQLESAPIEDTSRDCEETWTKNHGSYSPAVNWDLFASFDQFKELLNCFTPMQLSRVCERFARNYGAVRAGFPDLTVWNPTENRVKVVEVKSPNDRLSFKQILWIDFLMEIGVPVEVCHVVTAGAKRKSFLMEENEDDGIIVID